MACRAEGCYTLKSNLCDSHAVTQDCHVSVTEDKGLPADRTPYFMFSVGLTDHLMNGFKKCDVYLPVFTSYDLLVLTLTLVS